VTFRDATGYISKIGKDPYGLGRWCWTLYSGNDGHQTRVVAAYNACKNNKKDSRTSYQQQRQFFIMKKKDQTCPNKLFRLHLIKQLTSYSMLLLEIGVSFQPLQSSYQRFSFLATHSWMKMLWEKVDRFGIVVQTADLLF
jgi:hypothetical protein